MISKDMYDLIKAIPRKTGIHYNDLKIEGKSQDEIYFLLCDANDNYLSWSESVLNHIHNPVINLWDNGIAQIEDYERQMENQRTIEKTLSVAQAAEKVAIFSAVTALLTLLTTLLPYIFTFLQSFSNH